jgi:Cys-tRNA(Pro)/Cys-tRNA(Cys) deacylase
VLVDNSIDNYQQVIIGSGVLGYALSLQQTDLINLLADADKGQFVKAE